MGEWESGRVGEWESGRVGEWESGRVGEWESGRVGEWESGRVGEWESGRVGEWESGRVGEWKSGRVEEWKSGRVEEWKSGRVEEWKSGRVEEWKSGRVEEFIITFAYHRRAIYSFGSPTLPLSHSPTLSSVCTVILFSQWRQFMKFSWLSLSIIAIALQITVAAEDGYRLWLRYEPLPGKTIKNYLPHATSLVAPGDSATLEAIRT